MADEEKVKVEEKPKKSYMELRFEKHAKFLAERKALEEKEKQ